MQYHGIASYKFEYQLSTGGDWTTAVTTPSTATSYGYTYSRLTAGTGYNLRVTVTDNAGNSGTGTNTVTTKNPEKNPGGVINDIISMEEGFTIPTDNIITDNLGKQIDLETSSRKILIPGRISGSSDQYYETDQNETWYVFAEDSTYLYVVSIGNYITLNGLTGWANQPGLLDSVCKASYGGITGDENDVRSLSWKDFIGRGTLPAGLYSSQSWDMSSNYALPSGAKEYKLDWWFENAFKQPLMFEFPYWDVSTYSKRR